MQVKYELLVYEDNRGKRPFEQWLRNLKDSQGKAKIRVRLQRMELGHLGNHKLLPGGIAELKVDFGPGYRVYFGFDGKTCVLLLLGGDKGSQSKDIKKAHNYFNDYKGR